MKILVLATRYPTNDGRMVHRFVHVRNVIYKQNGIDVTVLNFIAKEDYVFDGIPVITLDTYRNSAEQYDLLLSHQPNLREHLPFFRKYGDRFPKYVCFFHGHEVLNVNKVYSKPYDYMRKNKIKTMIRSGYDVVKLKVWNWFFRKYAEKTFFLFVSKWMLDEFLKWTKIPFEVIADRYAITYNCIGETFEKTAYDASSPKEYDFVTIRSHLDGSKYCIDFVNALAKTHPEMKFLVVGRGEIFTHYPKAENLTWENRALNHAQIVEVMQKARCALMPTRTDAQGLMMCELAATGMPLITSDIPVCHEVFDGFENVALITNEQTDVDLESIVKKLEQGLPYKKNEKYYNANTSLHEVELIHKLTGTNE